jgi:hypothetical protein
LPQVILSWKRAIEGRGPRMNIYFYALDITLVILVVRHASNLTVTGEEAWGTLIVVMLFPN